LDGAVHCAAVELRLVTTLIAAGQACRTADEHCPVTKRPKRGPLPCCVTVHPPCRCRERSNEDRVANEDRGATMARQAPGLPEHIGAHGTAERL